MCMGSMCVDNLQELLVSFLTYVLEIELRLLDLAVGAFTGCAILCQPSSYDLNYTVGFFTDY